MFTVKSFLRDESGATAVEYALIAAGIGIVVASAVTVLGTAIADTFGEIACTIDSGSWADGTTASNGDYTPGVCTP